MKTNLLFLILFCFSFYTSSTTAAQNKLIGNVMPSSGDSIKVKRTSGDYYKLKTSRFIHCFDVGYLAGIGESSFTYNGIQNTDAIENQYHAISIRYILTDKINKDILIGLGTGYEHFSGDENYLPSTEYIPVFFNVKGYLKSANTTQFGFSLDLGYHIGLTRKSTTSIYYLYPGFPPVSVTEDNKYKGGFFINPALCMRSIIGNNTALNFSFGYEYQSFTIAQIFNTSGFPGFSFSQDISSTIDLKSSFLTFRFGIDL